VTQSKGTEALVSGVRKAALHFSKAAIEVVSGVSDLVTGVTQTVKRGGEDDGPGADGPQKIEIE
jgi:hypothetical protein